MDLTISLDDSVDDNLSLSYFGQNYRLQKRKDEELQGKFLIDYLSIHALTSAGQELVPISGAEPDAKYVEILQDALEQTSYVAKRQKLIGFLSLVLKCATLTHLLPLKNRQ